MLPLSFKEFLTFYNFDMTMELGDKFQLYLKFWGMLILREYEFNEARSNQVLEGIYSTIILRDIMQRNNQIDPQTLHKVMLFLCSNIGNITSPNKIGDILSTEGDIKKSKKYRGENKY